MCRDIFHWFCLFFAHIYKPIYPNYPIMVEDQSCSLFRTFKYICKRAQNTNSINIMFSIPCMMFYRIVIWFCFPLYFHTILWSVSRNIGEVHVPKFGISLHGGHSRGVLIGWGRVATIITYPLDRAWKHWMSYIFITSKKNLKVIGSLIALILNL